MWIVILIAIIAFVFFFWGILLSIGLLILKAIWFIISIPMSFLGRKSKQGISKIDAKLKTTKGFK